VPPQLVGNALMATALEHRQRLLPCFRSESCRTKRGRGRFRRR
jgi:hypothetical protein